MNETQRRPWWRLHGLTWIVLTSVLLSILSLQLVAREVDREPWVPVPPGVMAYSPFWEHGWPIGFGARWGRYRIILGHETPRLLDISDFEKVDPLKLTADVFFGIALLCGAGWMIERYQRLDVAAPRFKLSALFALVAWFASFLAIQKRQDVIWIDSWLAVSGAIANLALATTWLACFKVMGLAWGNFTSQRLATAPPDLESTQQSHR